MYFGNLPFRLESQLVRAWYKAMGLRPASAPFVSGDSFRSISDHCVEPGGRFDPAAVKRGEVVFVQAFELEKFALRILPLIQEPFVLISHNGDVNIDNSFTGLASERRIIRWFAQNATIRHPKVTAIPIGLENRNLHCNGVVRDFRRLARNRAAKRKRILYSFSVKTNQAERGAALAALQASPLAEDFGRVNSRTYRKRLVRYAFVASPPGNGVDCHRTWEALYLGVIPIVRRSPFYDAFENLPVLAVADWSEIAGWDESFLVSCPRRRIPPPDPARRRAFLLWNSKVLSQGFRRRVAQRENGLDKLGEKRRPLLFGIDRVQQACRCGQLCPRRAISE